MKGYIIRIDETIVSVVPNSNFDWNFVNNNKDKILLEKYSLPEEDETDFRLRMEEIAEKIRNQLKTHN